MKVVIVDKGATRYAPLGRMDAVIGMVSTAGNEIVSINGSTCQVRIEGKTFRKTEVCIDRTVAIAHGWEPPPEVEPQPTKRARRTLARNAKAAVKQPRGKAAKGKGRSR